ncbi:MAG: glycosyltransferase [Bacteroidaceae bacterium]|nr:glycosyltransferase [Bacteroidaceae bacterium]
MITVSIIVAVYNMEDYLAETLRSILATTYPHFEVVVMNDGSTDGSQAIIDQFASRDSRIVALTQDNQGVCHARNNAIRRARGAFLLPVDADDLLSPAFVEQAVAVLERRPEVKVVVPQGEFFGERSGLWKLPPFSRRLIARKNMIPITALYRRADWERVGGYNTELQAREDWAFWISVLKDGGEVVQLPEVGLRYRIRRGSKRTADRQRFRQVIDTLNRLHPEFMERELNGPLHYRRTWSRLFNRLYRLTHPRRVFVADGCEELTDYVKAMPRLFRYGWGQLIHDKRNQLRRMTLRGNDVVVKSFAIPNIVNRFVYGTFRASKAQRSFDYALLLRSWGLGSPEPVAWVSERSGLLFSRSYYVSRQSQLPHSYVDIIQGKVDADLAQRYLVAVAQTAARLHQHDCLHADFSRGNILLGEQADGSVAVELIDLNRLRFRKVSVEQGCANLSERLPMTAAQRRIVATAYAEVRGADAAQCEQWLRLYNKEQQ